MMLIKAWGWGRVGGVGGKCVGNWAVVGFIADCSACLSRDVWLPPPLGPLTLSHIHDCAYSLSHPSLCYFACLLPAVTFLGSELGVLLCWWLGGLLWEFGACSHGLQEPPTRLPGSTMAVFCVGALLREQGRILCERS